MTASISEIEITNFLLKIVMKTNKQTTNFHVFVCFEILFILLNILFRFSFSFFLFSFSLCLTFFDTIKNVQHGQCLCAMK